MAKKKARTPMPPRTVQAPKRRDTRSSGNPLSEVPVWVWPVSLVAVAGAIVIIFLLSSSSSPNPRSALLAAGCTYRDVPPKPPKHDRKGLSGGYHLDVPTLSTSTKGLWSTDPPSAGGHYPLWAVWDFYSTPVNPRRVVHNEEHGGVVMWWGPKVSSSTIAQLHAFYEQSPGGMVGTPYASLGNKIALTAWTSDGPYYQDGHYGMGHIAICSSFDQKAFAAFRSAFRGKGPEGIPLSQDQPGTGPGQ